jgi:hypothetical protein
MSAIYSSIISSVPILGSAERRYYGATQETDKSLTEMLASTIAKEIISKSDYYMEFHGGDERTYVLQAVPSVTLRV